MEKYSSDDMFIPVMPRILDPSLKFDNNSLIKSMDVSRDRFKKESITENKDHIININNDSDILENKQQSTDEIPSKKESVLKIVSNYKFYAIIFVSILVFIVLIYFIYNYFSSKKKKEDGDIKKEDDSIKKEDDNPKIEEVQKVKNYLSEYIDIHSDVDTESNIHSDMDNSEIKNNWNINPENLEKLSINSKDLDVISEETSKFEELDDTDNVESIKSEEDHNDILFDEPIDTITDILDGAESKKDYHNTSANIEDNKELSADENDDTDSLKYFNKYK